MTLISSIITDAFRESNMLPLGKVPTDSQLTEALRLYNALLAATYGGDAGEPLSDWPLGQFNAPEDHNRFAEMSVDRLARPPLDTRLLALNEAAITVSVVPCPNDGARMALADPFNRLADFPVTLDGGGRAIEGAATLTLNTSGLFVSWIYRADLANWLRVLPVLSTDENPFPADFDIMFVVLLAMRLNPRYGRTLDEQSLAVLKENKRQFVTRYLQSGRLQTDDSISWPFMSVQSYNSGRSFSSTDGFNRGNVRG